MEDIYNFLESNDVAYERHDHKAVYTVDESKKYSPKLDGASTKNLFLRDRKGIRHFLIALPEDKNVDLKKLSKKLVSSRLSFASPERLKKYLGIEPGSVSLLALANDDMKNVEAYIDKDIWCQKSILCHPLVNTSTLIINIGDMEKFLKITGHEINFIDI